MLGLPEWEKFIKHFPFPNAPAAWPFLEAIHKVNFCGVMRTCPRVFVSHRHMDAHYALRIAWLAHQEQFEYWLDVMDIPPAWTQAPSVPAGFNSTLLIAAIIEMALINCTHVIAAMTPDTAGSGWVPYEYGRIKDDPPGNRVVSAWRHRHLSVTDLPEYFHLAPIFNKEVEIRSWFQAEKYLFPQCQWQAAGMWQGSAGEPLPEDP